MEIKLYLQRVYEELHAHPELSLEEVWTAGFVADELRGMGFSVSTQVGGHGVVGLLDLGGAGLTLALRCDMDALPITEDRCGLRFPEPRRDARLRPRQPYGHGFGRLPLCR